MLDGFLLLYSCRVKLPHEAIKSKLASENIMDVREDDLMYFRQNLKFLDVSDNCLRLEQLLNLQALEELDLQYNNIEGLSLPANPETPHFPKMQTLHLSYNKIPPGHLLQLALLPNLQHLEISSNDFCTLPSDLSGFAQLEVLNLSSNNFSSDSVLVTASKLFLSISTIPRLKKLNLSRNKFRRFHSEELPSNNLQLLEEDYMHSERVEAPKVKRDDVVLAIGEEKREAEEEIVE